MSYKVSTFLSNITIILECVSFLVLRYTEPTAQRPYQVFGGLGFAWFLTVLVVSFTLTVMVIAASSWKIVLISGALNALFIIAYLIRCQIKHPYTKVLIVCRSFFMCVCVCICVVFC